MTFHVIPREMAFFGLFEEAADTIVEAAGELQAMANALSDPTADGSAYAKHIKDLEHAGDEIHHKTIGLLNTTFVVPLDRDDIYALSNMLDDVLDVLESVSEVLVLYGITEAIPEFRLQADVMVRSAEAIARAMRGIRSPIAMEKVWTEIVRLEKEGDRIYHRGVASIFAGDLKAMDVLKWKDLLDQMEGGIDRCEDVANAVESIAAKY